MSGHDPTEHIQEEIHEHAHHAAEGEHGKGPGWISMAALTAAFLAALAAVSGALASARLTESMHTQIEANDKWGEFQARSIKEKVLEMHQDLLASVNKTLSEDAAHSLATTRERGSLRVEALALEARSEHSLETHETLERGVAISVLTRRRSFFFLSIVVGIIGLVFFAMGLRLQMNAPHGAEGAHDKEHVAAGVKPGEGEHAPKPAPAAEPAAQH
jgi:hypothetical protein